MTTISHYTTTTTPIRAHIHRNPNLDITTIDNPTPTTLHGGWTWAIYRGPHPIANGPHAMRGTTRTHQGALEAACSALKWLSLINEPIDDQRPLATNYG